MAEPTAQVTEVFRSIQGEGLLVGAIQVFLRFAGCDRSCRFCDTPDAREPSGEKTRIHLGGGKRWLRPNPWRPDDLAEVLSRFGDLPLWLTGGEPLVQVEFLEAFLPLVRERAPLGLETHGLKDGSLKRILPHLRWIAADAKLPSSTGEPTDWEAFSRFLELAASKEVFVKAVVTSETSAGDLRELFQRIRATDRSIPLFLQPVTPVRDDEAPDMDSLEDFALEGKESLDDVRVLPQVHRLAGWR